MVLRLRRREGHKMQRVLINNLKGGEVLAQEVWDKNDSLWLAEGVNYKISYLNKLQSLGISHVYIEEDINSHSRVDQNEFNPDHLRAESRGIIDIQLKKFHKSGSLQIYRFEKLVFDIINDIMESDNVIQNLYNIKDYNNYTYEHSVNVTVIAIMISNQMVLSKHETYEIAMGCILHDLGKTQISEEILNKPASLSAEE